MEKIRKLDFDTLVIHTFTDRKKWQNTTSVPIYQSSATIFNTGEELSDVFAGKKDGFIYQRLRNLTNDELEKKIAILEGGIGAIVTSSGMAAITNAILTILKEGDEIVSSKSLFMSTFLLFNNVFRKFGIKVKFVDPSDLTSWEKNINEKTKVVYLETIGNPKMDVPDIQAISEIAHKNNSPLIVDNTIATPYIFRPIELGADIVIHSTTKYLSGHGIALGGAIIDSGNFDWSSDKYKDFQMYKEKKGKFAYLDKLWREIYINFGATQSPFHSFLTLIGIETLSVRMERHLKNCITLINFLSKHEKIEWLNYPGLTNNSFYSITKKQFKNKEPGALFTFGLKDQESVFKFIKNLKIVLNLANIGDTKTLVIHPWSSQYVTFPNEIKLECGIKEGMIRVSTGIEKIDDIIADFDNALKKI